MDYYRRIHCTRDPFTPLVGSEGYHSPGYLECLDKLLFSIRMRSGLSVVVGEDGTGKTTLAAKLSAAFSNNQQSITLSVPGRAFADIGEFIAALNQETINYQATTTKDPDDRIRLFNSHLLNWCIKHKKVCLLIIDNAELLPSFCYKLIDGFYADNFDAHKLLQVVLIGDKRLPAILKGLSGFEKRIHHQLALSPLKFAETRDMINWQLEDAAEEGTSVRPFSFPALLAIHLISGGKAGTIMELCRYCLLTMIIENQSVVSWAQVQRSARKLLPAESGRFRKKKAGILAAMMVVAFGSGITLQQGSRLGYQPVPVPQEMAGKAVTPVETVVSQPQPEPTQEITAPEKPEAIVPDPLEVAVITEPVVPVPEPPAERPTASIPELKIEPVTAPAQPTTALPVADIAVITSEPLATTPAWQPPEFLGTIVTGKGDSLGRMIRHAFGPYSFNPENTEAVLLANPHIPNPDKLARNDVVRFPAIAVNLPGPASSWWLRLKQFSSLESAYKMLSASEQLLPKLLIIPSQETSGLAFNVLLQEDFPDQPTALERLAQLPLSASADPVLLHGLSRGRYYYKPTTPSPDPVTANASPLPVPPRPVASKVEKRAAAPPMPPAAPPEIATTAIGDGAPAFTELENPGTLLGAVTVEIGQTFGDLLVGVYGPKSFNSGNITMLLEANPGIADPGSLQIGDTVVFPVKPVMLPVGTENLWWIYLQSFDTLKEAFHQLQSYKNRLPQLLILPTRSANNSLQFSLILRQHFEIEPAATGFYQQLKAHLPPDAVVLPGLQPNRFFYQKTPGAR